MRVALTLLPLLLFFPLAIVTAQEFNAGFVQGLWYSEEKIFVDDQVRIYVAIRNNTGSDLTGTVEFFDGEERIVRKSVQALNGRIIESWADWTPTYGSHTLSANLARIELHRVGSSTQAVEVTSALAEDVIFVDYDTDGDDIGNEDDKDDDGDSLSDMQEKENDTDPLIKNVVEKKPEISREDTTLLTHSQDDTSETSEETTHTIIEPPQGLERYLTSSPADTLLSSVTTYINHTRENLDTYREQRIQASQTTASSTQPTVNADGFGEITRSTDGEKPRVQLPKINGEGFFDKVFNVIGGIFNTLYTAVLAILSFILSHPMLVQIGVLILILFLMIKFAAKFGKRPKGYK